MSYGLKLEGEKFGRLTVIRYSHTNKHGKTMWLCRCECGNEIVVQGAHLKSGHTTSCRKHAHRTLHGKRYTRLYRIWLCMKDRCKNTKNSHFLHYGGRGIRVCEEWQNSFESFYEWAMSHGYADNLTIERVDINGNYEPSNCRWATAKEQQNNKRTNLFIEAFGQTHTLKEWSEITGIIYTTLYSRYRRGKTGNELFANAPKVVNK